MAQRLKCLPAMWEIWVRSLGRKDPLEKEMAIHSSILAWKISWTGKPGRSMRSQRVRHHWVSSLSYMYIQYHIAFPGNSVVKNLPAVQETQIQSLGQEDPLEKGMATHSSILAWKISWTEKPSRLQSVGLQTVGQDWATNTLLHQHPVLYVFYIGQSS